MEAMDRGRGGLLPPATVSVPRSDSRAPRPGCSSARHSAGSIHALPGGPTRNADPATITPGRGAVLPGHAEVPSGPAFLQRRLRLPHTPGRASGSPPPRHSMATGTERDRPARLGRGSQGAKPACVCRWRFAQVRGRHPLCDLGRRPPEFPVVEHVCKRLSRIHRPLGPRRYPVPHRLTRRSRASLASAAAQAGHHLLRVRP